QGLLVALDGRVAVALEVLDRAVVHALQEQDLHERLREGRVQGRLLVVESEATAPARAWGRVSAGRAGWKRNPWRRSQPLAVSRSRCSGVSTSSATTRRPRSWA